MSGSPPSRLPAFLLIYFPCSSAPLLALLFCSPAMSHDVPLNAPQLVGCASLGNQVRDLPISPDISRYLPALAMPCADLSCSRVLLPPHHPMPTSRPSLPTTPCSRVLLPRLLQTIGNYSWPFPWRWSYTCRPGFECRCRNTAADDAACTFRDNPNYGAMSFDSYLWAMVTLFQVRDLPASRPPQPSPLPWPSLTCGRCSPSSRRSRSRGGSM